MAFHCALFHETDSHSVNFCGHSAKLNSIRTKNLKNGTVSFTPVSKVRHCAFSEELSGNTRRYVPTGARADVSRTLLCVLQDA